MVATAMAPPRDFYRLSLPLRRYPVECARCDRRGLVAARDEANAATKLRIRGWRRTDEGWRCPECASDE